MSFDFEPPAFTVGQQVSTLLDGVGISTGVVFQPEAGTASGSSALMAAQGCTDPNCDNGANQLVLSFQDGLNALSMRVGAADRGMRFCFPEGTTCPVWARLVGLDASGVPVADTRDVLVAGSDGQGGWVNNGAITSLLAISDPAGRIRSARLVLGANLFDNVSHSYGNPSAWAIDDLVLTTGGTTSSLPPQPAPVVTIDTPTSGQVLPYPYDTPVTGKVVAVGTLYAFCIRLNDATPPPADQCAQGGFVKPDGTFRVEMKTLHPGPGTNVVYVFAYDLALQRGVADRSFSLSAAPVPSVVITAPTADSFLDGPSILVSADLKAEGEIASFCVTVNSDAVPAPDDCTRHVPAGLPTTDYRFSEVLDGSKLGRGTNKITVTMYDRFGQRASDATKVQRPVNLRIVGVEITQGVQSRQGFIQPYFPGVGLVDDPAEVAGAGTFTREQSYRGTKLILGGQTVVRVFVNQDGPGDTPTSLGGSGASDVSFLLSGSVQRVKDGSLRPIGGIITPHDRPTKIPSGPAGLTTAVRAKIDGAYTFILPHAWTNEIDQAPQNRLRLRIQLMDSFLRPQCGNCRGDDTVDIDGIDFHHTSMGTPITPVEIVYRDGNGNLQRPSNYDRLFQPIEPVVPHVQAGLPVTPFVGQVDATDIFDKRRKNLISDEEQTDAVLSRVIDFGRGANPPARMLIGVSPPGHHLRGLEKPVTYCCDFKGVFLPRWEPVAVAQETPALRSMLHEKLHQHGFFHAGPGTGPPTCPPVKLFIPWPPDNQGRLQGYGLDRRADHMSGGRFRIITPTDQDPYYDVMSYCGSIGDDDVWISPRNWDAVGEILPNGPLPDDVFDGEATPAFAAPARGQSRPPLARLVKGLVTISAQLGGDDKVTSLHASYTPGAGYAYAPAKSPYSIVASAADGRTLARSLLYAPPGAIGGTLVHSLEAAMAVPPTVARLRILHDTKVIGNVQVGPGTPQVRFLTPRGGTQIPAKGDVKVTWHATDNDNTALTARLEYSADGRHFRTIKTGITSDHTTVPATLLTASAKGRLRVVVSDGYHQASATSGRLVTTGPTAALRIAAPAPHTFWKPGESVDLLAADITIDGRTPRATSYAWYVDGKKVASGRSATTFAPERGRHRVKVVARTPNARTRTATAIVEVKGRLLTPRWPGKLFKYPLTLRVADVRTWQRQMVLRGWKLQVDGRYGPASARACRAFQREKGLTADGIVGPLTWRAAWSLPITPP